MSKRFGRNQRRKMREQLAAATEKSDRFEQAWRHQAGLLSHMHRENADLRTQLDNAKAVIGRYHPAFPPERVTLGYLPAPGERYRIPVGPGEMATLATMTITAGRDNVFNEVHFRLIHGDVVAAYAVSETAMRNCEPSQLCEQITAELVAFTVKAYRKVTGGGHD